MRTVPISLALLFAASACDEGRIRRVHLPAESPAPNRSEESASAPANTIRFSVAAVESPRDTYPMYSRLLERMGKRIGVEFELVQRRTYREVNDLLVAGKLDAALVCTGGYLDLKRRTPDSVEVLATMLIDGQPTYQAVIIVPTSSPARSVAQLAGKRFAFTDELSLTGREYVVKLLEQLKEDPQHFFGSTIYTKNHDRSIQAVAAGLVDGATVHSGVLAHLVRERPDIGRRVRVIHRSPPFAGMPVVASTRLAPEMRERLRGMLLALADDEEAGRLLLALDIDGFAVAGPALYESTERLLEGRR